MQLSFKPDPNRLLWLLRLADALTPLITIYLLTGLTLIQDTFSNDILIASILLGAVYVFLAQLQGLYRQWLERSLMANARILTQAWILAALTTYFLVHIIEESYPVIPDSSLGLLISWLLLTPLGMVVYRLIIYKLAFYYRNHAGNRRKVAILGAGKTGQQLAERIKDAPWLGYEVIGFFDDKTEMTGQYISGVPVLATSEQLYQYSLKNKFDELYICLPLRAEYKIKQVLNELADTTATVKFVPDLFSFDLMHTRFTNLKGLPVFSVYDSPLNALSLKLLKRTEDILFSLILLVLLMPLMTIIALAVKLSSKGPIIFKQARYGLNGKEIKVYKFRSMNVMENQSVVKQAKPNDPRVTPLGRFLRQTSLDELPQLINVLQGRMSLVGPRPHASAHNEEYRKLVPRYMQRHIIKPGITGWAQINGWRGETDTLEKMQKRIEFDLHYINNWSLWLDIKILILTLIKGLMGKNVY